MNFLCKGTHAQPVVPIPQKGSKMVSPLKENSLDKLIGDLRHEIQERNTVIEVMDKLEVMNKRYTNWRGKRGEQLVEKAINSIAKLAHDKIVENETIELDILADAAQRMLAKDLITAASRSSAGAAVLERKPSTEGLVEAAMKILEDAQKSSKGKISSLTEYSKNDIMKYANETFNYNKQAKKRWSIGDLAGGGTPPPRVL